MSDAEPLSPHEEAVWRYGGSVHPRIWTTLDSVRSELELTRSMLKDVLDVVDACTRNSRTLSFTREDWHFYPSIRDARALLKEKDE